jgi:hypothetical protein
MSRGIDVADREMEALHPGHVVAHVNSMMRLSDRRQKDALAALEAVTVKKVPEDYAMVRTQDFRHIKENDVITREIAGVIWATREEWFELDPDENPGNYWTFDRGTGVEEDEGLGWGVSFGATGSMLVNVVEE